MKGLMFNNDSILQLYLSLQATVTILILSLILFN